jgi:hypothetical protein
VTSSPLVVRCGGSRSLPEGDSTVASGSCCRSSRTARVKHSTMASRMSGGSDDEWCVPPALVAMGLFPPVLVRGYACLGADARLNPNDNRREGDRLRVMRLAAELAL